MVLTPLVTGLDRDRIINFQVLPIETVPEGIFRLVCQQPSKGPAGYRRWYRGVAALALAGMAGNQTALPSLDTRSFLDDPQHGGDHRHHGLGRDVAVRA